MESSSLPVRVYSYYNTYLYAQTSYLHDEVIYYVFICALIFARMRFFSPHVLTVHCCSQYNVVVVMILHVQVTELVNLQPFSLFNPSSKTIQ